MDWSDPVSGSPATSIEFYTETTVQMVDNLDLVYSFEPKPFKMFIPKQALNSILYDDIIMWSVNSNACDDDKK